MAHLASIYKEQGRLEEAEEIEVKVLDLQREMLGEKYPGILESMADLAIIYRQQGRSKEAEEMEVKFLRLRREVLGEKYRASRIYVQGLRPQLRGYFTKIGRAHV